MSTLVVLTDPNKFALTPFTSDDGLGAVSVTYGGQTLLTVSSDLANSLGKALTLISKETQSKSSLLSFLVAQGVPEELAVSISAQLCNVKQT